MFFKRFRYQAFEILKVVGRSLQKWTWKRLQVGNWWFSGLKFPCDMHRFIVQWPYFFEMSIDLVSVAKNFGLKVFELGLNCLLIRQNPGLSGQQFTDIRDGTLIQPAHSRLFLRMANTLPEQSNLLLDILNLPLNKKRLLLNILNFLVVNISRRFVLDSLGGKCSKRSSAAVVW